MGLLFLHISVCCSTVVARRLARVSEKVSQDWEDVAGAP